MKKLLKMLIVVVLIVSMFANVYCSELKLNENGFYMMEYNPYIIRGLTEMDLDENDLQVKEKLVSYLSWHSDVSKATLKVDFESEDEEVVEKIIRYLGVDFNENAFRYAKKLKGFHYDIDDIRKDMKNEGFTSANINYAIEKLSNENAENGSNVAAENVALEQTMTGQQTAAAEQTVDPSFVTDKVKEIIETIQTINYFVPLSRKVTRSSLRLSYKSTDLERALDECKVDWQKNCNYYYDIYIKEIESKGITDIYKRQKYLNKKLSYLGFTSDEIFKAHSDATTKFQINVRDYENLNDSEIIAKLKMNNIPDNQINQCLAFIKGNSAALYESDLQVEE